MPHKLFKSDWNIRDLVQNKCHPFFICMDSHAFDEFSITPFLMFSFDKCSFWNIWRLRYVFIGHQALLCIQDQIHFDYSWYGCFWVVLCHDVEIKPLQTSTELQAVSLRCACITKLLKSSPVVPHFYLVQCIHVCKCMWLSAMFSAYKCIANWIMWPNGYEQHQLQFYWGCSPSLVFFFFFFFFFASTLLLYTKNFTW